MEKETEITLKVKLNTYKEVQNLLKHDLKITKEDISRMIEDNLTKLLEKKLNNHDFMYPIIEEVINNTLRKKLSIKTYNIEADVNKALQIAIGERIMTEVKKQMSGITFLKQK